MAFYGGHTYGQVASILDVPLGTVKARIRDALIKLRGGMLSEP
jgi:RNA polymerase sigma-70 factor (ECF subfamily)